MFNTIYNNLSTPDFLCPGNLDRPIKHNIALYLLLIKCTIILTTLSFLHFNPYLLNNIKTLDLILYISFITISLKYINIL